MNAIKSNVMVSLASDFSAIVQSVAVLIGALLPLAVAILAYLKTHTNSQSIQKVVNTSDKIVDSLEETDKWVLSHQAGLTKLIEVVAANPEVEKLLQEHDIDINKMKADVDNTTQEINALYNSPRQQPVTNANPIDRKLSEIDQRTRVTRS